MYGVPYVLVCLNCREEFSPIEGNERAEFCSWDCEEEAFERDAEEDNYTAYNEGFGRDPFHQSKAKGV